MILPSLASQQRKISTEFQAGVVDVCQANEGKRLAPAAGTKKSFAGIFFFDWRSTPITPGDWSLPIFQPAFPGPELSRSLEGLERSMNVPQLKHLYWSSLRPLGCDLLPSIEMPHTGQC
jgi:hypothetical protein